MLPEIIETARLRLRPFRLTDVDDVLAYAADPEWGRYLPVPQPYTAADAEAFVASQVLQDRQAQPSWAIERAGTAVGGVELTFYFDYRLAELGYSLGRRYWGQGLAPEAARAVIQAAFEAHPSLRRIRAMAHTRNAASHRVLEKLGMAREGLLRQNSVMHGELVDEAWYGLLRAEWERPKEQEDR